MPPSGSSKRIPAEAFNDMVANSLSVKLQAEQIIQDAQYRANVILGNAEQVAKEQQERLYDISEKELRSFIDEDRLKRHATIFVKLLQEINSIVQSHENMVDWLVPLVETAIHRIIGEIDVSELTARLVRQGVEELDNSQRFKLFVHPSGFDDALSAREDFPDLMDAVSGIIKDPDLEPGVFKLSCDKGTNLLSITARIDRVMDFLATSPALAPEAKIQS